MSQTINCPKCKTLINVDEEMRKQVEEEVRGKYSKEERMKMENSLKKELRTQLTTEITNSVKLKHQTELQAEKTKNLRMGEELKKTNSALIKTQESLIKAQKPIDQGSPELDGEAQEVVLENYLKEKYSNDVFTPVPKGKPGADCIQEIMNKDISYGKILWESKNLTTFSEKWVDKLLSDMSANNIGFGVLASETLPKKMKEKFELRENGKVIICKFDETLDVVSSMVRLLAVTVNKARNQASKNSNKSQSELWNIFNSETFVIEFKSLIKTAIKEKSQIEKDKTNNDKSYKKRIELWNKRKDHIVKIVNHLSQVEGTKVSRDLISYQDGTENEEDDN